MSGLSRQLLHVHLEEMYDPGKHLLVIGITGGGKTSTLFKVIYNLYKQEETVARAGSRRGFIQGQLTLSSNIYHSAKKFRKMNLRLVGSTHNYNDLHPPLRAQFNYYLLKAMRREMVPERFLMYAYKIEAMPVNKIWIVDEGGRYQMDMTWTEYSIHHLDDTRLIRLSPKRIGRARP